MNKSILAAAIAAGLALPAAQADDLGTIVVSAARTAQTERDTPASITVITRKDIEASGADNLPDLLRGHAGIVITDLFGDGSRSTVDMRGFGGTANSNVLVLVDGRRLNNVDLAGPALNSIALKDVERIEIVKGSAGSLFGDQAVGGVIHVITRTPREFAARLTGGFGSYGRNRVEGRIADATRGGFEYRLTGEVRRSDNYREHNRLEYRNLLGRVGWRHEAGSVFLEYQDVYENLELPGALTLAEFAVDPRQSVAAFANDYTETRIEMMRAGLRHDLGERVRIEAEYTRRDEDRDIRQSSRFFVATTARRLVYRQDEFTPRVVLWFPSRHGEARVTAGYDYLSVDYLSEITRITDRQRQDALYFQASVPGPHGLTLTVGARHARVRDEVVARFKTGTIEDSVNVWTAGLRWQATPEWSWFLRRDGNFRFAKVDEFTYTSPGVQLRPQTGVSWEAGAEWRSGRSHAAFTLYRLDLEDEIAFDPTAPRPVGAAFSGANVNFDPTLHKGFIIEAAHDLAPGTRLSGTWSYVRARFEEGVFTGNTISGVPEQQLLVALDQEIGGAWHGRLEAHYRGPYYLAGDNANAQPEQGGYTLLNAVLDWRFRALSLSLRVNNLANKRYAESRNSFGAVFPSPERNWWLTASYAF